MAVTVNLIAIENVLSLHVWTMLVIQGRDGFSVRNQIEY